MRRNAVLAVSMVVMNVSAYGFNIVASPWLGPRGYGVVAAIISILMVLNVVSMGLQATAARRVAAEPGSSPAIEAEVMRTTYLGAVGVGLLCLAAAPLLNAVLNMDSLLTVVMIAIASVPLTVMGGQAGLLQGEERWFRLSAVYVAFGLGRLLAGILAMMVRPDPLGAATGIAIGAFAPMIVGWLALRGRAGHGTVRLSLAQSTSVLREVVTSSQALLAFLVLANVDIVIARATMSDHDAGLYAGGLILTKAVLFLPQFVILIAFPAMSRETRSRDAAHKGLLLIGGIGALATAGVLLSLLVPLPVPGRDDLSLPLAVLFIGGPAYSSLAPHLWAWTVLGTILAMIQLLVYGGLARQTARSGYWLWAATALIVGLAVVVADGPVRLLWLVTAVDTIIVLALYVLGGRAVRAHEPDPA